MALSLLAIVGALCACQDSAQGKQLDINYATATGTGSVTGASLKLPHGRYTFFSYADPASCVNRVSLLDQQGKVVVDDGSQRAAAFNPPPGGSAPGVNTQTIPTMVQQELPSGSYRVKVAASGPSCAWRVEQILNYVLSDEAPLKPTTPPPAPGVDVVLGNSNSDLHFQIPLAGIYDVQWNVTPCDRYSGDLVRSGGGIEHLGDGVAVPMPPGSFIGPQTSDVPMFLGAGDWRAKVMTTCFWQINVRPWVGPRGGGSQGFRR